MREPQCCHNIAEVLNKIISRFILQLRTLHGGDIGRDSTQKNSPFNILEQDQKFILALLDRDFDSVSHIDFKILICIWVEKEEGIKDLKTSTFCWNKDLVCPCCLHSQAQKPR